MNNNNVGCLAALQFMILGFCVFIVLSAWGCLPESKPDPNYTPSDEYRMNEVERKLEMLENNQNW